jgi:cold-inducible RNA-binding protein
MKMYVGNMPFSMNETELRELFEAHGTVDSVNIITDRDTGRPRGFGFVEMADDEAARAAMAALDNAVVGGRNLKVNEARPRNNDRGGRGGGGDRDRGDRGGGRRW